MLVLLEFYGNEVMWIYGPFNNNEAVLEFRNKREEEIVSLRGTANWIKEPRDFSTMALQPVKAG